MNARQALAPAAVLASITLAPRPAAALPTMIRLGYPNCVSCHISPQGGGLLNSYGRGIDEAQSLRAGEYTPSENRFARALSWGGRITQDVRDVSQEQVTDNPGQPALGRFRTRFMYRNATELGKGFRVSAVVYGENDPAPRPVKTFDHPVVPDQVFIASALLQYRPNDHMEFAAGRDLLPSGVYVSDMTQFIKSRNRMGYYDTSMQVKMFLWGKRYQVVPFAFGPSGEERSGEGESGGGTLAEFDLFGKQRHIVGVNLVRGSARNLSRRVVGAYTRLGFGKWGILAEHDITDRTTHLPPAAGFRQHATYAQAFYAVREWFVVSLVGERLGVERPFQEERSAGKVEVAARLTSQVTFVFNTRVEKNRLTGEWAPAAVLQLALKTVN